MEEILFLQMVNIKWGFLDTADIVEEAHTIQRENRELLRPANRTTTLDPGESLEIL